ncbi:MAG: bifunctional folylpolyglutamate synthase/dihydrofolate synthase [Cytophagaceae bacterium]|nr:bifunctional folylpolyglutamate synthase/dihydrofolate synthase [Cytophagaceae bacterium]
MTFEEATHYLFSSFPSFEKSGKTGINEGLRITRDFLQVLGNPHLKLRCVHVAGTNGKGSSSHFLASILQEAGYKTGLFTSPHVKSFTERIRINGVEIPEQVVVDFIVNNRTTLDQLKPSFFEITTVMAFEYFASQHIDVAIIETGLGGRLDSSNVIEQPIVCLITNIGFDHTEMLGNDLPSIAAEKAGIIKAGRPVVQSESNTAYNAVIKTKADELKAPLAIAQDRWTANYMVWKNGIGRIELDDHFSNKKYDLQTPLAGIYQTNNLCGVLETCRVLRAEGFNINHESIGRGVSLVLTNTHMKGRWQTLSLDPLIICDAVHNISGWQQVLYQLKHMPKPCSVMILGFSSDKKPEQFIDTIPAGTKVIFSNFQNKRASNPQALCEYALNRGLEAYAVENVNEALSTSIVLHPEGSFIFVGGSIYLLSELNNI